MDAIEIYWMIGNTALAFIACFGPYLFLDLCMPGTDAKAWPRAR